MFKLPNPPSPRAGSHELADFAELLCWVRGSTSTREIIACLGRLDDNENNIGITDDDDENAETIDEVMNEIERRMVACRSGYPFRLELSGTVLNLAQNAEDFTPSIIYLYLLLGTRLNMKDNRNHAGIDGTHLLEILSARVLQNYLGSTRARSIVFGTSNAKSFKDKVNELCCDLSEGVGFRNINQSITYANDDKLDTIGWVPFSDNLPGKLIVFGQCKTGSNWREATSQLQPETFIKKWMQEPILVTPMRAYFVAEAADRAQWKGDSVSAGILFDRCRLVDWCDGIPVNNFKAWTLSAKNTLEL